MVSASSAAATQFGHQAEANHRADGEHGAEGARLVGADPPAAESGRAAVRAMRRVDIGVVPHVQRRRRRRRRRRCRGARRSASTGACGPAPPTSPTSAVNTTRNITSRLHQREIFGDVAASAGLRTSAPRVQTGFGHASTHSRTAKVASPAWCSRPCQYRCGSPPSSFDARQRLIAVEGRRRRQRPFERAWRRRPMDWRVRAPCAAKAWAMPNRNTRKPAKAM